MTHSVASAGDRENSKQVLSQQHGDSRADSVRRLRSELWVWGSDGSVSQVGSDSGRRRHTGAGTESQIDNRACPPCGRGLWSCPSLDTVDAHLCWIRVVGLRRAENAPSIPDSLSWSAEKGSGRRQG